MSVQLHPSTTLSFHRPLTQLVKRTLAIHNPNAQPIVFKVKTTAPKLYCVRPNSGIIEPRASIEVSVMLQPMKEEPPLGTKCKDKFLIQSTYVPADKENMQASDIWSSMDSAEDSKVLQQKLKVVYLAPEGQTLAEEDEAPPSNFTTGDDSFGTVPRNPSGNYQPMPDFHDVRTSDERPHEGQTKRAATPDSERGAPVPTPAPVPVQVPVAPKREPTPVQAPVPAPVPVSHKPAQPSPNELIAKYKETQLEIERLRGILATSTPALPSSAELRRRNRSLVDDGSTAVGSDVGTVIQEHTLRQPDGVPLEIVVAIAFAVFVTTYLFF